MEDYPIDIVLAWVDGGDPEWQKEKIKYSEKQTSSLHSFDYKDWGLLKYWFRSIEKNAPWVRNLYFVTCGQTPDWLNTENPKLKLIDHKDYIPEQYLPTFSSHVIELNFHRIDGLSEHFIYFNDDTYLIGKVSPEFFFKNGCPRDCAVINPIAPANNNCISHLQLTNAAVINQHFKKKAVIRENLTKWINPAYGRFNLLNILFSPWARFPGLLEKHLPSSFLKSTFEEVWDNEFELLDKTCQHKFRDFKTDVNQWLIKEWQIASGNFAPRSVNCGKMINVSCSNDADAVLKMLRSNNKMVCINDHLEDPNEIEEVAQTIRDSFEAIFPEKCSFEK